MNRSSKRFTSTKLLELLVPILLILLALGLLVVLGLILFSFVG